MTEDPRPGRYRHYKHGNEYTVVDVVFHSDVYHHFEYPKTMTRDLARALAADGQQ